MIAAFKRADLWLRLNARYTHADTSRLARLSTRAKCRKAGRCLLATYDTGRHQQKTCRSLAEGPIGWIQIDSS